MTRQPEAIPVAENLWRVEGPVVRWFTVPFPTRMIIARLADGGLWIYSPIALTPDVRRIVESLGAPRYLVSPNKIHHLFWAQWQAAYRDAISFYPPGLPAKRPDLVFEGPLRDRPEPGWAREIDQLIFKGSRTLEEVIFFHRRSRTLIVGDLVENFDPDSLSRCHRVMARYGGVLAPDGGTPLDYRLTFLRRHDTARQCLQTILSWQPDTVVMCHGLPVRDNAPAFLKSAFVWLRR